MINIRNYIQKLPKAELHIHIEGSFEPELMFEIAQRNNIKLKFSSVEELRAAYNFNNLQEFLDIYYQGAQVLITQEDFFDLTYAYLKRAHQDHVVHTEIFFDPQTHTDRGIAFSTVISGILEAMDKAKADFGISSLLIMSFLRHLSEEAAFETLEMALPWKSRIIGVGLDSSEVGNPPKKFERVYAKCRELGFKLMAHAGEEGPPSYVADALDLLKINRIDHGNRCLEDNILVERIQKEKLGLTVCPLSNLKLQVVKDMAKHPIKTMLDKGLKATVNSDDPAYFGGYMNDNFMAIQQSLHLSQYEVFTLALNAIEVSFLSPSEKKYWIRKIREYDNTYIN